MYSFLYHALWWFQKVAKKEKKMYSQLIKLISFIFHA